MTKHFNKLIAVSVFLFIFLMIIPGSFAQENQTNLESDAISSDDILTGDSQDIYFDASAAKDGDGSKDNPYNTIDASRLKNNSNIYFENGNYYLDADGVMLSNVNIYGKNPENTIIDASTEFWTLSSIQTRGIVTISNVTFINARFNVNGTFNVSNSIFSRQNDDFFQSGGAIATFTYSYVNVDNCKFIDYASNCGGAILSEQGVITISNSEFNNCHAYYGFENYYMMGGKAGAILACNSTLNLLNSVFYNNGADDTAGAVYVEISNASIINCIFEGNAAEYGGAIYNHNANLTVLNSEFKRNFAQTYGGSIAFYNMCIGEINDSSFEGDIANRIGGSIHSETSILTVNNVNFTGCRANFGSAIAGLISGTKINNIIANNNTAGYYGGAIYQVYGTFSLSNSEFSDNTASKGGAIYLDYVLADNINSNRFINNCALSGGAIYAIALNETSSFQNNTLINNDVELTETMEIFIGDGNYTMMRLNDMFYGELPSRYNSRDYNLTSSVKDQADGGYCWAFTSISVLEACIKKATGIEYDLSENNLINLNKLFSDYGLAENEDAGNIMNALGYLLSWLGPVNESDDPYDSYSKVSPVLNSLMHVQNVLFVDMKNASDLNSIKEAIINYGAVGTHMYWFSSYLNESSYYFDEKENYYPPNHAITIVGWDDNYPKEKFRTTPEGDGAWIVKNSWGTYAGEDGYYYVSYYDASITDYFSKGACDFVPLDRIYAFILNDTIRFDKNYQYDFAGATGAVSFGNNASFRNKFISSEDEYLAAVSTYFMQNTEYDINIYVNDALVHTQSSQTKPGYYTINLDKIIPLKANDIFTVEFIMNASDKDEIIFLATFAEDVTKNNFKYNFSYAECVLDNRIIYFGEDNTSALCIKAFTILNEINTTLSLEIAHNGFNPVNITANVCDEYGRKLTYGTVTFNIEGENYTVDVVDGIAELSHNFTKECPISATFDAVGFGQSTATDDVIMTRRDVDFDISVSTYQNSATINISSSINVNESIEIIVNNETRTAKLTNGETILVLYNLTNGNYEVKVSIDTKRYIGQNNETFNVNAVQPKIISSDLVTLDDGSVSFTVRLVDENDLPIKNKTIRFNLGDYTSSDTTNNDGEAVFEIDLANGNYVVTSGFDGDESYMPIKTSNSIKVKTNLTAEIDIIKVGSSAEISLRLSKDVDIDLILIINDIDMAINSKDTVKLNNLPNGEYNVSAFLNNDNYLFTSASNNFNISVLKTRLLADDFTTYYGSKNQYSVILVDENNCPMAGRNITYSIPGIVSSKVVTDENGMAFIPINLTCGNYEIDMRFGGEDDYIASNSAKNITVLTTVILPSSVYTYNSLYSVKLVDGNGNPLDSDSVKFVVDGAVKQVSCENGMLSFKIVLANGAHTIEVTNPVTGEVKSQAITVKPRLSQNKDITMYYGAGNTFKIKVLDDYGNVASGVKLSVKIGSSSKTYVSSSTGYITIKMTQKPGKYKITASYKGYKVSNNLVVKTTLITKNIAVKKGKSFKYTAKLLNTKGKALKYKIVTFKFGGKTYKIKTDKYGNANLKVTKKLKAGKYTIKTSYGKLSFSNKITVK